MRRSRSASLLALLALTVLSAACGDTDDDTAATPMPRPGMGGDMGHDPMDGGMGHDDASPVAPGAQRLEVTATSFEFDPDEITIAAGADVAIVLTSHDVLHDFTIDELDAHVAADTGDTEVGGLRADEPGRYTFYCSVPGHRAAGMEGTLIVEAP